MLIKNYHKTKEHDKDLLAAGPFFKSTDNKLLRIVLTVENKDRAFYAGIETCNINGGTEYIQYISKPEHDYYLAARNFTNSINYLISICEDRE